mmetsp:Transcript_3021/g.4407  ORF Transcript_3021/g.4407 Transcript_3021/m.4407 type:complete len:147 (+) Transcript_3021:131-571(+)
MIYSKKLLLDSSLMTITVTLTALLAIGTTLLPTIHAEKWYHQDIYTCRGCVCAGPRTVDLSKGEMYEFKENEYGSLSDCKENCKKNKSTCWKCVRDEGSPMTPTTYECEHIMDLSDYEAENGGSLQTLAACNSWCGPGVALGGDDD